MKRSFAVIALLACTAGGTSDAETVIDLNGAWAYRVVTTSLSQLPVIGKIENESRYYALATVAHHDTQVDLELEPCWVHIVGEMKRVKTIVPDEARAVMGARHRSGTLSGTTLTIRTAVDVVGARLKTEWSDPLPESAEDPTQWDEDGDGKPGITIRIMGPLDGEVYVVQRNHNSLKGTVAADGLGVRGLVTWTAEQRILGASSVLLRSNPNSQPHPDPARSYFQMRRMPADTTCDTIRRKNERLFQGPA